MAFMTVSQSYVTVWYAWSLSSGTRCSTAEPASLFFQVDVYDEGSYTCSIQTKQQPKTSQVYLIVQGT
jgi:hypothetical protein